MARKLVVEIVGDARSLERAFAKSSKSAKAFGGDIDRTTSRTKRGFGGLGKAAGFAAGAIGTAGLIGVTKAAFAEFAEGQKVTAQTNAAIRSTGKAAKVSAKHVEALAEAMLKKTGIDDEAIQTAENMLLTFTNVRNEVGKGNDIFDQATEATANLATAMAGGAIPSAENMQRAALQLGKALNDPIKGVGALSRVGIQFTSQQKAQIKALVKSGQTLKAQKIIMAELNKEVGGRAAAAGRTFAGQWSIVRNTLLNLSATLVAKLMPSIQKLLGQLVRWLNNSKNQKKVLDTVTAAASAVEVVVRTLAAAFQILTKFTGSTRNTMILLVGTFAAFKALKLVAYIAGMTKAMRGFAAASAAAGAAGAGGGVGGMGRFGKVLGGVGAVATGAPLVAGALRKIPGWDRTFKGIGGAIAGATVARQQVDVQVGVHMRGGQLVPQVENQIVKRQAGRPHRRRGAH